MKIQLSPKSKSLLENFDTFVMKKRESPVNLKVNRLFALHVLYMQVFILGGYHRPGFLFDPPVPHATNRHNSVFKEILGYFS